MIAAILFIFMTGCQKEISEDAIYGKWLFDVSDSQYMIFYRDGTVLAKDTQGESIYQWNLIKEDGEDYIQIGDKLAPLYVDKRVMHIGLPDENNPIVLYRDDFSLNGK